MNENAYQAILNELTRIRMALATPVMSKPDISLFLPVDGGAIELPAGESQIDFVNGKIITPGKTVNLGASLASFGREMATSMRLDSDVRLLYRLDGLGYREVPAKGYAQVNGIAFASVSIRTDAGAKVRLFISTSPTAVISDSKVTIPE